MMCFQALKGMLECRALTEEYLRKPSRADARRVTGMHHKVHKMPVMVKERIDDDEVEDGAFYDTTIDATSNEEDDQVTEEVVDRDDDEYSGYDQNIMDSREKAQLVHKRWEDLYDNVGSKNLRTPQKGIYT